MINKNMLLSISFLLYVVHGIIPRPPPTAGKFFYSDLMSAEDYGSLYIEGMYGKKRVCAPDENCKDLRTKMALSISTSES